MELKRQMGFGSYQTAWSWLHKTRRAMVRPGRAPLAARVEADETYVGGPRLGTPGRAAAGKITVAGAVESGRGQAKGRRLGRLRLAVVDNVSAKNLQGLLGQNVARPATVSTDGWSGYAGLDAAGYRHQPLNLGASWGDAALRLPAIHVGRKRVPNQEVTRAAGGASRRKYKTIALQSLLALFGSCARPALCPWAPPLLARRRRRMISDI